MVVISRYGALSGLFQSHERRLSTGNREGQRISKPLARGNAHSRVVHRFHKRGYWVFHSIHRFVSSIPRRKMGGFTCGNGNANTCSIAGDWA